MPSVGEKPPKVIRLLDAAFKAEVDAPSHVQVTGRASRLQIPVAARRVWRIVRMGLIMLAIPVILFFLIFLMLSRR